MGDEMKENRKKTKYPLNLKKSKKVKPLTPHDIMKYEIAEELGLTHKVKSVGWPGLTAAETGRIGGLMTARIKKKKRDAQLY
jgi:small acid-soluble spore protein F (minor alpha/beta-type SASP)